MRVLGGTFRVLALPALRASIMNKAFRNQLLLCFPAPVCALGFGGLLAYATWKQPAIEARYRDRARVALDAGDLQKAEYYYNRVIDDLSQQAPRDQLNWVRVLFASGDQQDALERLRELAPDDSVGYPPAHLEQAKLLMSMATRQPRGNGLLDRLAWHLRHGAIDDTAEHHQLWATYHLMMNQPDKALSRMEDAALQQPRLWINAALLARRTKRPNLAERHLESAENAARLQLEADPHEWQAHGLLIEALIVQNEMEPAEAALQEALRVADGPEIRKIASNFFLLRFDQSLTADRSSPDFSLLAKAARMSRTNPAVFDRMIRLFRDVKNDKQREGLKRSLLNLISRGEETAFAHFALSTMYWLDADQRKSMFHIKQAHQQAPEMLAVANNLAWMLANGPEQDLERAERLIMQVLEQQPDNRHFLDTWASVLEAQQRWEEALSVLEPLLARVPAGEQPAVRERLANIYRELGQEEMAEIILEARG